MFFLVGMFQGANLFWEKERTTEMETKRNERNKRKRKHGTRMQFIFHRSEFLCRTHSIVLMYENGAN